MRDNKKHSGLSVLREVDRILLPFVFLGVAAVTGAYGSKINEPPKEDKCRAVRAHSKQSMDYQSLHLPYKPSNFICSKL